MEIWREGAREVEWGGMGGQRKNVSKKSKGGG
jgi:hypothetical protein